jgi:hypothetical protein
MPIDRLDEWLLAENLDGSRQYVVHTQYPRFVGEIIDTDVGGSNVLDFEWLDEPPLDATIMARLMREAGEAIAEYDRRLDEDAGPD